MRNLAGVLHGEKIYWDDPDIVNLVCNTSFAVYRGEPFVHAPKVDKCAYCAKPIDKCGCGASK